MVLLSGAIPGFVPCLNFGSSLTKTACFNKTALEPFQACSSNQLGILGPKLVRIHSLIQAFDFIVTCFLLVQQLLDQLRAFLRLVQGVLERAQILEQVRLSLVVASRLSSSVQLASSCGEGCCSLAFWHACTNSLSLSRELLKPLMAFFKPL